jgi:hypothetical protein
MIVIARALTPRRADLALDFVSNLQGREKVHVTNSPKPERLTEARAVVLIVTGEPVRGEASAIGAMGDMIKRMADEGKLWVLTEPTVPSPNTIPPERIFTSAKTLCGALFPTK